jgi:hypothetical protein
MSLNAVQLFGAALAGALLGCHVQPTMSGRVPPHPAPVIVGDWWQIAGVPDLGICNTVSQQPVDFAIWQAADGTWQLQSCIRGTSCGGKTRLFYRWQGQSLTDTGWQPIGIAMQANPSVGETAGGLQAPYVTLIDGVYQMFYGDWVHICRATSTDGKTFTRFLEPNGQSGLFSEGTFSNTRDPMVLPVGGLYYTYYTASVSGVGTDLVRTSADLINWSDSTPVAEGGSAGTELSSAECPFVVYRETEQQYYLFRTQHYGLNAQTSVYRSPDPMNFGNYDDHYLVETLAVAAPEIFQYQDQWYIASLLPSLQGIRLARLDWQ